MEWLNWQTPLWASLLIGLAFNVLVVWVISLFIRLANKPANAVNNRITRGIRSWLGVPKIIVMSQSEIDSLGGMENVPADVGDILFTRSDTSYRE